MHNEPLLKAICETPDDDTVRLAYADWLDENEQSERAEFIRSEIGIVCAGGTSTHWVCRTQLTERRYRPWMCDDLSGMPNNSEWEAEYQRGFVRCITCAADGWLAGYRKILARYPVQKVTWTRLGRYEADVVADLWRDKFGILPPRGMTNKQIAEEVWKGITFDIPDTSRAEFDSLTHRMMVQARESGRRSAMEANERFMRAFMETSVPRAYEPSQSIGLPPAS